MAAVGLLVAAVVAGEGGVARAKQVGVRGHGRLMAVVGKERQRRTGLAREDTLSNNSYNYKTFCLEPPLLTPPTHPKIVVELFRHECSHTCGKEIRDIPTSVANRGESVPSSTQYSSTYILLLPSILLYQQKELFERVSLFIRG